MLPDYGHSLLDWDTRCVALFIMVELPGTTDRHDQSYLEGLPVLELETKGFLMEDLNALHFDMTFVWRSQATVSNPLIWAEHIDMAFGYHVLGPSGTGSMYVDNEAIETEAAPTVQNPYCNCQRPCRHISRSSATSPSSISPSLSQLSIQHLYYHSLLPILLPSHSHGIITAHSCSHVVSVCLQGK